MMGKNFWNHQPEEYAAGECLEGMSLKELRALCLFFGIPKSGVAADLRAKIRQAATVRIFLHEKSVDELTQKTTRLVDLVDLAKSVGLSTSPRVKRVLSARLLNWRNDCRRKGQASWGEFQKLANEIREEKLNSTGIQTRLRFDS